MSVADPIITPSTGPFTATLSISITCATPGASIYYTIDGSTPTILSTLYTVPLVITRSTVVKALAFLAPSGVATSVFTLTPPPPPPPTALTSSKAFQNKSFTPLTGNYRIEFDAVPSAVSMDGVIGFAAAPASSYGALSIGVRFSTANTIDAMSGAGYAAGPAYTPGTKYHFTLNVSGATYSAIVNSGSGAVAIGAGVLPFRAAAPSLSALSFIAELGSFTIDNITLTPGVIPPPPPPIITVGLDWPASPDTVAGYNVYRGVAAGQENTKLNTGGPVTGLSFTDKNPAPGPNWYDIKAVVLAPDGTEVESDASSEVLVTI